MKLPLSILAIFLVLTACKKHTVEDSLPVYIPPAPAPISNTKKILALGDSYTIGQSVSSDQRFPDQVKTFLGYDSIQIAAPTYVATTGWTTGNLLSALNSGNYSKDYDFVTLLIGVNNQYQGQPLAQYKTDFTELLTRAIQYAANRKNRVFVLSIPDYSVTPFAEGHDTAAISRAIDDFNAANKAITLQMGVSYTDITAISRLARTDQSFTAQDGLHPSGKQYTLWAQLLKPLMKASL